VRYDQKQRKRKLAKKRGQTIGRGLLFKGCVRRRTLMGIPFTVQDDFVSARPQFCLGHVSGGELQKKCK